MKQSTQERLDRIRETLLQLGARYPRRRFAVIVGLGLLLSLLLPLVPILAGVAVLVAVLVHLFSPDLRPYVELVVHVPVARPGKRRARLAIAAGTGVVLVLMGCVSATMRGAWRSSWEERAMSRAAIEDSQSTLIAQARALLSENDVAGAELALMDARAVAADSEQMEEAEDLLDRIQRSGDSEAILAIVTQLSAEEREALESGIAIPESLDFGERALTYRAVELALVLLQKAKLASAQR